MDFKGLHCLLISKTLVKFNEVYIWLISVTADYVSTQPGASDGLHLVLWTNESDSMLIASPGHGYKVGYSLFLLFYLVLRHITVVL